MDGIMRTKKRRNSQDKTKRDSVSRAELHALKARVKKLEKELDDCPTVEAISSAVIKELARQGARGRQL